MKYKKQRGVCCVGEVEVWGLVHLLRKVCVNKEDIHVWMEGETVCIHAVYVWERGREMWRGYIESGRAGF